MINRLPHVRAPDGDPDVCVHCREEWVDLLTLYETDECSVRLRGALDDERATVAALRASVPPVYPSDYGHEVWSTAIRDAVAAERAAVVAWLRNEERYRLANAIERGEHLRKENE